MKYKIVLIIDSPRDLSNLNREGLSDELYHSPDNDGCSESNVKIESIKQEE